MPTYAGYIMTAEHQLQWLRLAYPEMTADENYIPSLKPFFKVFHKHKLSKFFGLELVVVPDLPDPIYFNGNAELSRLAYMFVRRSCSIDSAVWLPPRETPGVVSDSRAGAFLRKLGLVTSDWVVIHVPVGDSYATSWVNDPVAAR
ncbi:unnamed protein product [Rhizoctonia solani]|uniref:Uncharacterized protein n=1 Tax=Rhizoctonia solani TaxID=456999 RepID=A0A8H3B421_9AGAM|nr:unnamed protein product [Rhizoctonia solani]